MTDNPWVTPGAQVDLSPNPWVNPPRSCDFCQGLGEIPVEGGGKQQCPYCHGDGTDRWREAATAQRRVEQARNYKLVKWAAILSWPVWLFVADRPGGLIINMVCMFSCFYLLGWALHNWDRKLEQRKSGIGSPTAPMAIGGLALFAVMRHRHRHPPGDPLRINKPWQG